MGDTPLQSDFQAIVWEYYRAHGRHGLPWRQPEPEGSFDAYKITVSEIMLQQTQVARVIPKYSQFLAQFPTVTDLAAATLGDVLRAWSGLGYNRRAKFLWQSAQQVMHDHKGEFPHALTDLTRLPGIGANTAGAILAYAYNQPVVFIETNIRTVFVHHFFADEIEVSDKTLLELVAATLDHEQPREWYWALMDYGSFLKQSIGNLNHRSRHYTRQSAFAGSRRQLRGQILRLLAERPFALLEIAVHIKDERLKSILADLVDEQLITSKAGRYQL